jgi:uncharacterized protein
MIEQWWGAVSRGDLGSVRSLLETGASVNKLDRYNQSALMIAARHGQTEVARLLIGHGADLDITAKYGLSALMLAVVNLHAGVSRVLVDAGANIDIKGTGAPGFDGKTAADLAEGNGQRELAEYIRRRGQ